MPEVAHEAATFYWPRIEMFATRMKRQQYLGDSLKMTISNPVFSFMSFSITEIKLKKSHHSAICNLKLHSQKDYYSPILTGAIKIVDFDG